MPASSSTVDNNHLTLGLFDAVFPGVLPGYGANTSIRRLGDILNYAKTDEQEKTILKNIYNYGGFRESNNDQLIPIRQLELFKDRRKVEGDDKLAAADKAKQLAEIDKQLAALKK